MRGATPTSSFFFFFFFCGVFATGSSYGAAYREGRSNRVGHVGEVAEALHPHPPPPPPYHHHHSRLFFFLLDPTSLAVGHRAGSRSAVCPPSGFLLFLFSHPLARVSVGLIFEAWDEVDPRATSRIPFALLLWRMVVVVVVWRQCVLEPEETRRTQA